jgi:hypothetical protein
MPETSMCVAQPMRGYNPALAFGSGLVRCVQETVNGRVEFSRR